MSYTLLGPDGPYRSPVPGGLGGHRRNKIYGTLDCPGAAWWLARGHYVSQRVFFADEPAARACGFRPCARCLPEQYRAWKDGRVSDLVIGADGLARPTWAASTPLMQTYYDTEWGMPIRDERGLFERLSLEAFQSGLSWATVLRKRENFRAAFADFDPDTVAAFGEADVARLMDDAGIIRMRKKIEATITNANATLALRKEGGLAQFIWSFQPADTPRPHSYAEVPTQSAESLALSKALRKKGFTFVGPTTMFALMEAVGIVDTHLVGSHRRGSSGVWI